MMQSIAMILRIILIYIIVKLANCSAHAETADYLQMTLNPYELMWPTTNGTALANHHAGQQFTAARTNDDRTQIDNRNQHAYAKPATSNDIEASQRIDRTNSIGDSLERLQQANKLYLESANDLPVVEQLRPKRNADRQDMCDTAECTCKTEMKFLTVDCHFEQLYTFSTNKLVRSSAETLLIHLSGDAEFRLDGNVFKGNRLNRIMIQGTGSRSGREHVEIGTNAFNGNAGPFPEIDIVNVHTVVIRPNSFYYEFKLNITNCAKVYIFPEAFANTTFHGHFENIHDFQLSERAFSKTNTLSKISIYNSRLDDLKHLDASLREIKFSDSTIGEIKSNAFDVLTIDSIVFEKCHIGTIQTKALTEKLLSSHFELIGCNIETIETAAIAGSGIGQVIFQNNSINTIKGKAIELTAITAQIQNNTIKFMERFWFRVEKWSTVLIENNHFGVYHQIGVEITKDPIRCVFENNFINKAPIDSLNFKSPHCRVKQVSFDLPCSCNSTYFQQLSYVDIRTESYCKIEETLAHCFNASLYNVKAYKEDICDESTQIDCVSDRMHAKSNGYFIDLNNLFNRSDKILYVYLGGGILLIIVIIILLIAIIRRCLNRKKTFDDGPMRDIMLMEQLHPTTATLRQITTAQPYRQSCDTFSKSDLVVIHQTLEDMKDKYPPEFYDQVYNNTQKLIAGKLTETDKVKTIGEIVNSIDEYENTGTDFVAFTGILYTHLGSGTEVAQQISAPIYAEPTLTTFNVPPGHESNAENSGAAGDGEHIYAEPMNLQQPLLRSEYNVPIDNSDINSHMYTEPVTGAIDLLSSTQPPTNTNFDPSHLYAQPSKPKQTQPKHTSFALFDQPSTSSAAVYVPNPSRVQPKISDLKEKFMNSAHSSSQESNSSHSDHSGASGATLPLDERIEYADA